MLVLHGHTQAVSFSCLHGHTQAMSCSCLHGHTQAVSCSYLHGHTQAANICSYTYLTSEQDEHFNLDSI